MKVVINACYGGFGLSEKAVMRYAELKGLALSPERSPLYTTYWLVPEGEREDQANFYAWSPEERQASNLRYEQQTLSECAIPRDDLALVQVVEELGVEASGFCADLAVVEIPDGVAWQIEEYDGLEHVAEKHRTWGAGL